MSASTLKVSELDFNNIKNNLKQYLRSQTELTDYDFEGSAMTTLIDLMSYVTHYNAVNANFAMNETFLDTSKIRSNVVSHSKMLGYTPRSTTAPVSNINIQVNLLTVNTLTVNNVSKNLGTDYTIVGLNIVFVTPPAVPSVSGQNNIFVSYTLNGDTQVYTQSFIGNGVTSTFTVSNGTNAIGNITLNRGTKFNTVIDDKDYTFVNDVTTEVGKSNNYEFSNINIFEGTYKEVEYVYDSASDTKFLIPDKNVVTSSIILKIIESSENNLTSTYNIATNIINLDEYSNIYFLQENKNGYYEILFGDGNIGNKPQNGNIISIEYITSNGPEANGASIFSLTESLNNIYSDVTITTNSISSGGDNQEDIESIRYNSPLTYVAQNRAITAEDYKSLILNSPSSGNVEAITVWGGELNDPPVYGKVFISIKPKIGDVLPDSVKDEIINNTLKPKNVMTITPEFVEPDITNLYLQIYFKYNPNITNLSADDLELAVREKLRTYNELDIKQFSAVLRYSNMLKMIDETDTSIINSFVRIYMSKTLVPTFGINSKYIINYSSPIYNTISNESIISSTKFTFDGVIGCELRDFLISDGSRIIKVIKISDSGEIIIKDSQAGSINIDLGQIILNSFSVNAYEGSGIEIRVLPDSYDIAAKRNQLLNILVDDSEITGQIDTMVTGGTTAGVNYTTTSRH